MLLIYPAFFRLASSQLGANVKRFTHDGIAYAFCQLDTGDIVLPNDEGQFDWAPEHMGPTGAFDHNQTEAQREQVLADYLATFS
jgi:hypothetical protein